MAKDMKKILLFLMAVLCLIMITACANDAQSAKNDDTRGHREVSIETPYCDLVVTKEFNKKVENVVSEDNPYTVSFRMKSDDTELFSIVFGDKTENLLGTLVLDDENVVIYATFNEFESTDAHYETYCKYQEEINVIVQHLISDYDFIVNEVVELEDTSTFDINTSLVSMKYPAKWKDKVTIDVSDDSVKFSRNGEPLFDICFYECDGLLLGQYKETPVYVVYHTINKSNYSEEDLFEMDTMQDDVNVIFQALMDDSNFAVAN